MVQQSKKNIQDSVKQFIIYSFLGGSPYKTNSVDDLLHYYSHSVQYQNNKHEMPASEQEMLIQIVKYIKKKECDISLNPECLHFSDQTVLQRRSAVHYINEEKEFGISLKRPVFRMRLKELYGRMLKQMPLGFQEKMEYVIDPIIKDMCIAKPQGDDFCFLHKQALITVEELLKLCCEIDNPNKRLICLYTPIDLYSIIETKEKWILEPYNAYGNINEGAVSKPLSSSFEIKTPSVWPTILRTNLGGWLWEFHVSYMNGNGKWESDNPFLSITCKENPMAIIWNKVKEL